MVITTKTMTKQMFIYPCLALILCFTRSFKIYHLCAIVLFTCKETSLINLIGIIFFQIAFIFDPLISTYLLLKLSSDYVNTVAIISLLWIFNTNIKHYVGIKALKYINLTYIKQSSNPVLWKSIWPLPDPLVFYIFVTLTCLRWNKF